MNSGRSPGPESKGMQTIRPFSSHSELSAGESLPGASQGNLLSSCLGLQCCALLDRTFADPTSEL